MANWGSQGIGSFVPNTHRSVYSAIDPSSVTFPDGFVVAILGASGAIGAGIAYSYAKAQCSSMTIIISSRRVSVLDDVARKCRQLNSTCTVKVLACDISSSADVEQLASVIKTSYDRLDSVIVCSGISGPVTLDIQQGDPGIFKQVTEVNYIGTYHAAHYLLPIMLASSSSSNASPLKSFIVVGSNASFIVRGPIANTQYCVSKLAQMKLVEHIHEQYASSEPGLLATSVHPGAVASENALDTAPKEFMEYLTDDPELCGAFCVWLNKSEEDRRWLGGRLLNASWDVDDLVLKRDEIVHRDLLKARMSL